MHPSKADHLLVVDDDSRMLDMLRLHLEEAGYRVTTADEGAAALEALSRTEVDLVLSDVCMPGLDGVALMEEIEARKPDTPVVLMTAFGTVASAVEAMRRGAADYVSKPFRMDEIRLTIQRALEQQRLRDEVHRLRAEVDHRWQFQRMIGKSRVMQQVFRMIERASSTSSTVLIKGETGTGKEMVARAIHRLSRVKHRPFVVVDCSAIPEALAESELFGHVRGAFTGATKDREGLFQRAEGGTLFLDEVGCLAPAIQAKLLRALDDRSIRRVGSDNRFDVCIRYLAATNHDLLKEVRAERFREDLYYRLKVLEVRLPPLRERPEDIPLLAHHFLQCTEVFDKNMAAQRLDDEAIQLLISYPWPGNVRELANAIEHVTALASGPSIGAADLPPEIGGAGRAEAASPSGNRVRDRLQQQILDALEETGGNRTAAARNLGIDRRTLQRHLARMSRERDSAGC